MRRMGVVSNAAAETFRDAFAKFIVAIAPVWQFVAGSFTKREPFSVPAVPAGSDVRFARSLKQEPFSDRRSAVMSFSSQEAEQFGRRLGSNRSEKRSIWAGK